jgi:hypothetical protein
MVAAVSAPVEIPEGYLDGPWSKDVEPVGYGGEDGYCIRDYRGFVLAVTIGDVPELRDTEAANAALIALAPQMAAELLALRADVTRLTASLAAAERGAGDWEQLYRDLRDELAEGQDDVTADKLIGWLAELLKAEDWSPAEGTETWDGDVRGTLWNILVSSGVIDDEDGAIAMHASLAAAEADAGRLREALEFYAEPANWRAVEWGDDQETPWAIPVLGEAGSPCDCGDTARAALSDPAS